MRELTDEQKMAIAMKIMSRRGRELHGEEYVAAFKMLRQLEPNSSSNNQRTWTDTYIIGDQQYDVTYGFDDNPDITARAIHNE